MPSSCDCSLTSYQGDMCDVEKGVMFTNESALVYDLNKAIGRPPVGVAKSSLGFAFHTGYEEDMHLATLVDESEYSKLQ